MTSHLPVGLARLYAGSFFGGSSALNQAGFGFSFSSHLETPYHFSELNIGSLMQEISAAISKCLSTTKRDLHEAQFVRSMLDEVFHRGMYVQSMEVFEVISKTKSVLRIDLSILGLDRGWDTRAEKDAKYARQLIERKLDKALESDNEMKCEVWLGDLTPE